MAISIDEESKFGRFKKSKWSFPVSLLIASAVTVLLYYLGIELALCGLGFVLVGAVAYLIIKRLSGANMKKMLVCGGVIFLVVLLFGTLVFSPMFVNDCRSVDDFKDNNIEVLSTTATDTSFTIEFRYDAHDWTYSKIKVICSSVNALCYNNMSTQNSNNSDYYQIISVSGSGTYTASFSHFDKNKLQICQFQFGDNNKDGNFESKDFTGTSLYKKDVSFGTICTTALPFTAVYDAVSVIFFVVIAYFADRASKSLDKTRAQMEADGRLYPKGYGRCKQCGTIVLPGEEICRKCGAYVDVPEDIKNKKKGTFQCSDCGAEVPGDAEFCPNCGARFDEDDDVKSLPGAKEEEKKK